MFSSHTLRDYENAIPFLILLSLFLFSSTLRQVYISYLDYVHFFRPKQYRTLVYFEISNWIPRVLQSEWVRKCLIHTLHVFNVCVHVVHCTDCIIM